MQIGRLASFVLILGVVATPQASYAADSGPVAQWHMDEGEGNIIHDTSEKPPSVPPLDGSITGATWVEGICGHALSFNGSSDYVETDSVPTGQFTLAAWVYLDAAPQEEAVILEKWLTGRGGAWVLSILSDLHVALDWGVRGSGIRTTTRSDESAGPPIELHRWHFLVASVAYDVTTNKSSSKIYVDGVLKKYFSASENPDAGPPTEYITKATIGAAKYDDGAPTRFFRGSIDEVTIYDRALSNDEVTQAYTCRCNYPPVIDAGNNVTTTTAQQSGTTLQGTATDPDHDDLQCRWLENTFVLKPCTPVGLQGECPLDLAPPVPLLGVGEHVLTLECFDGCVTRADTMVLTINNSPPSIAPIGGGTVELGTDVSLSGQVADYDGDTLTYRWFEGPATYSQGSINTVAGGGPVDLPVHVISGGLPLGQHIITLEATDGINPSETATITVGVIDTQKPTLQPTANPTILWPPDHRMVNVAIQAHTADNSGTVALAASVVSSEPPETDGDGNTIPDFTQPAIDQVTGLITLQLRAERQGQGTGRIYAITITVTDGSGNVSTADVKVVAPHDRGKKSL